MNYIVLDTETTNGFDDPFCYDVGYAVLNESFEVIETRSFVVAYVFLDKENDGKRLFCRQNSAILGRY